MKFKNLLSLLLISMSVLSCSEDLHIDDENEDAVSFEVQIPINNMKTRSYSDASLINTLKCYVYQQDKGANAQPLIVENIPIQNYDTYKGAKYTLQLPKDQKYDLVVIATSCEQENSSGKIYYNRTNRSFNVNYNKFTANDESVDCFLGTIKNVSPGQSSYSVSLKRPFAQLNIGTKDLKDYNDLSVSQLNTVGVSIDGAYSSMDVMSGNVTGDKSKVSFPQASVISGNTFPKEGMSYLSMNYLLVNQRENAAIGLRATAVNGGYVDMSYADIPLQRNNRTNLFGNLLTKSNDYKVEISPDFTGVENKDVNEDYDLILKVFDNYSDWDYFTITGSKTIDLLPYVDNNKLIKIRWDDLGLENSTFLEFDCSPTAGGAARTKPVLQIIKFDISELPLTSVRNLFHFFQYVRNFDAIKDWDVSNITDMTDMFSFCFSAWYFDLSNWNTRSLTNAANMFTQCRDVNSINLSGWNTKRLLYVSNMFSDCKSLISLDLSNWDLSHMPNHNTSLKI